MLRYTPRVPNQKLSISHWFPITAAVKSGFRRVKDGGVNDPPTVDLKLVKENWVRAEQPPLYKIAENHCISYRNG